MSSDREESFKPTSSVTSARNRADQPAKRKPPKDVTIPQSRYENLLKGPNDSVKQLMMIDRVTKEFPWIEYTDTRIYRGGYVTATFHGIMPGGVEGSYSLDEVLLNREQMDPIILGSMRLSQVKQRCVSRLGREFVSVNDLTDQDRRLLLYSNKYFRTQFRAKEAATQADVEEPSTEAPSEE